MTVGRREQGESKSKPKKTERKPDYVGSMGEESVRERKETYNAALGVNVLEGQTKLAKYRQISFYINIFAILEPLCQSVFGVELGFDV